MNDPKYRLQALGGLSAHVVEPAQPVFVGQRKRLALLAAIASDGNGGVARDRLLTLFWPESDTARARNALKQLIHGIRRELGDDAIVDVNGELALNAGILSADVQEFRAAIQDGRLERANELYRGPFLDGVYLRDVPEFERWVGNTRRVLELQYSQALEQLVVSAKKAGDDAASVRWARTLAAIDPLNTRSALILINALSASRDLAGAIRHGELHASLLRQELDVGTPNELRDALAALRASHPAVDDSREIVPPTSPTIAPDVRSTAESANDPSPVRRRPFRLALSGAAVTVSIVAVLAMAMWPGDSGYSPARPGALVPLTHGQAVEIEADISPDGQWLAFVASPVGETRAEANSHIYVRRVDGGAALPITSDFQGQEVEPRWSPDGARIAFRTPAGIFVAPAFGGTPQLLVPGLARDPYMGSWLSLGGWSHDGSRIAYADSAGIWVRDLVHGTTKLVARATRFGAHSPVWSPDDERIAYSVGTGGATNIAPSTIWLVPVVGGPAIRLTDADHLNTAPVFARNGRSIFYVSNRDGARDIYQQLLPRRPNERVVPTRLTTGANAVSISLSADGRRLVYAAETMRSNVWSAPITPNGRTPSAAIRPVTQGNQEIEGLSVSRDGAWLLYDSNRSGNQDVYRMPLDGGEAVQLTTDPADDFCPSLSPDGKEVAFHSVRGGGNRRVFTMFADGERQMPAVDAHANEQEWGPTWSPDGRGLIFDAATTGARHVSLISRLPNSRWGNRRDLYAFAVEGARWSPDGRYIAALSRDSGLVLLSPDGRLVRVLARPTESARPAFVVWGGNPGTVYYHTVGPHGGSAFWAVSIAGGPPRLLLQLNDSGHMSRRAEFDTDGRRIFFTISTDDAAIWKLELLR